MHGALTLADETPPTIESIDTCARAPKYTGSTDYWYSSFYPGDYVPIVVTFSEPVSGDYELAYLDGTETKYLSAVNTGIGGIIDATVSPPPTRPLSRTRVFYYPVQKTDSTGIHVLGVRPADENACTDAFGNKFKSKPTARTRNSNHRARQPAGRISDRQLCFALRRNRPERPAKAVFTVALAGDETFQTKWLAWSKGRECAEGHGGAGRRREQAAELHLDVSGTGSSQKYILTGTMDLPNVSADTVHTAEIYYNGSLYYGACASFTQTPVTLAGTDALPSASAAAGAVRHRADRVHAGRAGPGARLHQQSDPAIPIMMRPARIALDGQRPLMSCSRAPPRRRHRPDPEPDGRGRAHAAEGGHGQHHARVRQQRQGHDRGLQHHHGHGRDSGWPSPVPGGRGYGIRPSGRGWAACISPQPRPARPGGTESINARLYAGSRVATDAQPVWGRPCSSAARPA